MKISREALLQKLTQAMGRLIDDNQELRARVTELEVQARFALGSLVVKRPITGGIVTAPGQPTHEIVDGWTVYVRHGGRDFTLNLLDAEFHNTQIALRVQEKIANGDARPMEDIIEDVTTAYRADRAAHEADRQSDGGRDSRSDDEAAAGAAKATVN